MVASPLLLREGTLGPQGRASPLNSPRVTSAARPASPEGHRSSRIVFPSDAGWRWVPEGHNAASRASSPRDAGSVMMQRCSEGSRLTQSTPGSALLRTGGCEGMERRHGRISPCSGSATAWSPQEALCHPTRGSSPGSTARAPMAPVRQHLSAVISAQHPVGTLVQQLCRHSSPHSNATEFAVDNISSQPQQHSRPLPEASGSAPMPSIPASPQRPAGSVKNAPCNMNNTSGHRDPVQAMAGSMSKTSRTAVPASDLQEHPVYMQDQQRQAVAPAGPQGLEWLQKQDAHLQAIREGIQACCLAVQAEALERSNAVAQVERTCKALIFVEMEKQKASIGALNADVRVIDSRLHELLTALDVESDEAKGQSVLMGHQAKSKYVSPRGNQQTHEQRASTLETGGPAIATPVAVAEAEVEADAHRPVPGTKESELVKVPTMPGNEPLPADMGAILLDRFTVSIAELRAAVLDDLKGALEMNLRETQQGLWHALEHEMSERKQFENRTLQSFQQLVGMEDVHACSGGDGAAGPRRPMACSPSDLSGVLIQGGEALNPEAQVTPQSSCIDDNHLPRDNIWRAQYQEMKRRVEGGYLNQTKAVELAMRALSALEIPGASLPLDSEESPSNTFISNITGISPSRCSGPPAAIIVPPTLT